MNSIEPLESRIAPATFHWNMNADGFWNVAANWFNETSGMANDGIPNGAGDTAILGNVITADHTITIPMAVTITVGSLVIDDNNAYTVAAAALGKLVFDSTSFPPVGDVHVKTVNGTGAHVISAPIVMNDPLAVTTDAGGMLSISGGISESGGAKSFVKAGAGVLAFTGSTTNSYTGGTTVENGRLELNRSTANVAVPGTLVIGDALGSASSADLRLVQDNQISDSASVTVKSDGLFNLGVARDETIGALTVNAGSVDGGTVRASGMVAMTGGSIGSYYLHLGADLVTHASASTASITAAIYLNSPGRTFTIEDGSAAVDLDIPSQIIGNDLDEAGGLVKDGPGTLQFSGAGANFYTGTTTVNDGVLSLAKSSGVNAIAGPLAIGDGTGAAGSASVADPGNQIANTASVTVVSDGKFALGLGASETVGMLTLTSASQVVRGGALAVAGLQMTGSTIDVRNESGVGDGSLTLNGDVTATSSATASSLIMGFGTVDLGGATRTFTVNDGPQTIDFEIQNQILDGGVTAGAVTKAGAGTLRFSGTANNLYTGTTTVNDGVFEIGKFAFNGPLVVGDASGAAESAIAREVANNVIGDATAVTIKSDGLFDPTFSDNIGPLTIEDGKLLVSGSFGIASLDMTGGVVEFPTGTTTLKLSGNVTATSSAAGAATISGPGTLSLGAATRTFSIADGAAASDLVISAKISGNSGAGLTKAGPGTLELDAANTYTGATTVNAGALRVVGTVGDVALNDGLLSGGGTVGAITASGGSVEPGSSPGLLTATDDVTLGVGSTLAIELNGATAGTDFDQLRVAGTLTLGGTLAFDSTFAPADGQAFVIIDNDGSTDAVAGTFTGLPQNQLIENNGRFFRVSYTGGDGNDVVLIGADPKVTFSLDSRTAFFTDADGDQVMIKTTRGAFDQSDFSLIPRGAVPNGAQLALINLSDDDLPGGAKEFAGTNLTITAKRSALGGDGFAAVGYLNATGADLGNVGVRGDLGRIDAGDPDAEPGLKSLTVQSLGLFGLSTQLTSASLASHLTGNAGKLVVRTDMREASFTATGAIGSATLGGSLLGGSIHAGTIIGVIRIGGDIIGSAATPVVISAVGKMPAPTKGTNLAIKSLTVAHRIEHANILAGYDATAAEANADASIGPVEIGGDWIASNLIAGAKNRGDDGANGGSDDNLNFGDPHDALIAVGDTEGILAKIASITIGGQVLGTSGGVDHFGFVAQQIGSFKVGGTAIPLLAGKGNDHRHLAVATTDDVAIHEI